MSKKENSLVEVLSDPAQKALWDAMLADLCDQFAGPQKKRSGQTAPRKAEVVGVLDGATIGVSVGQNEAQAYAKEIENLGGQAFVERHETSIDVETGAEEILCRPTGKYNVNGQALLGPSTYWTDARGIILPLATANTCVFRYVAKKYAGEHTGSELPSSPDTFVSGYSMGDAPEYGRAQKATYVEGPRSFIYDQGLSAVAKKFLQMVMLPRMGKASQLTLITIQTKNDQNRHLQGLWASLEIVCARPDAKETTIPLPDSPGWVEPISTDEKMPLLENFRRGVARRKAREAKLAAIQPELDKHAATIEAYKAEIAYIKGELAPLRPHTLVFVQPGGKGMKGYYKPSELLIEQLKDKAREFRRCIQWETDAIEVLKGKCSLSISGSGSGSVGHIPVNPQEAGW